MTESLRNLTFSNRFCLQAVPKSLGSNRLVLATTDARAAVEHVRQAGGEITLEPTDVDFGNIKATIAFFKGSSGEVIAFF